MFDIEVIETSSLGDRSYLLTDGTVAAVIDPQRDIDRILDAAENKSVRITHVLETHIHNDYVTGGLELSRTLGADYVIAAGDDVAFDRTPISDGDIVTVGRMRLQALHTPGHTHHHLSFALFAEVGDIQAVFTGGSMLYGATGRTDLVSPRDTDALTHAQYRSVRRLAAELSDGVEVLPTHGFGSFCSATPTTGDKSTIGEQRHVNPALTQPEQDFVDELVAGLGAYPAYYAHMMPINSTGPDPIDLSMPEPVDAGEIRRRIDSGEWVVDLRSRTAFAAGHLSGSLSFELSDNFVTYLGWLRPWDAPLTLIGTEQDVLAARRELARIGIDRLLGAGVGDPVIAAPASEIRSYPVTDFAGLARAQNHGRVHVLDTRRDDERVRASIPGSQHIPIHELPDRREEVPRAEVWVHCGSGYRAAIAASLLDDGTRSIVHIDDDFDHAMRLGLTASSDDATATS
ncbi:MAG: MBL fold metallo-hydrolase [Jatrophihabitantaceae bacterium]